MKPKNKEDPFKSFTPENSFDERYIYGVFDYLGFVESSRKITEEKGVFTINYLGFYNGVKDKLRKINVCAIVKDFEETSPRINQVFVSGEESKKVKEFIRKLEECVK